MSATALFSVVIPCYNYGRFLPETVASLARQTGSAGDGGEPVIREVIIVDDGSTDDTPQVAQALVLQYPQLNIELVRQENKGPSAARNAGISRARGEWIVALDSDDILADGFLQQVAEAIRQHPEANAVTGAYREFGATESDWKLTRFNPQRLKEHGNILSCCPYKKELWELGDGYDSSNPLGGEDWHFWLKCLAHGLNMLCLPIPMLLYRKHEDGRDNARLSFLQDFKAMNHCHEPELYARDEVLQAHQTLLHMAPESVAATKRTIVRHPELPLPHFLLGLFFEGQNRIAQAKACYSKAIACAQKSGRPGSGQEGKAGNGPENSRSARPESSSGIWPGVWQAELRLSGLPE